MNNARILLVAVMWLVPSLALAHGSDGHPADPNLHVGTGYDECFVQFAPNLTQDAFRRFAREFGSVSAFRMTSPPTTLGARGLSIAVEQLSFTLDDKSAAWNDTFAHPDSYHELGQTQAFPNVRVRVGLTDRLDVGALWTRNFSANYGWLGLEGKYGWLQQSETMPISLAVRGAYTKTLYVQDMNMHALTAEVAAGRKFWNILTSYVGVGSDLILVRERSDAVNLKSEAQFVPHLLGGLELRYWHIALGVEGHVSDVNDFKLHVASVF